MTNKGYQVVVFTNNKYLWAIHPFAKLFNKHWSDQIPVTVLGYSLPSEALPPNFEFLCMAVRNIPANAWTNPLIDFLRNHSKSEHIIIFLDDYWLCRDVDEVAVDIAYEYMQSQPDILRFDLTADRLYAGGMYDLERYRRLDIIETPHSTPYQVSLQVGMWNRSRMLEIAQPNKSPWEFEIHSQLPLNVRVLGCRQWPIRYANAVFQGRMKRDQLRLLTNEDLELIELSRRVPSGWEYTD